MNKAAESTSNNTERSTLDRTASPCAVVVTVDACAAECHARINSGPHCVKVKERCANDKAERHAVDGITSCSAGARDATGSAAKHHTLGGNSHYSAKHRANNEAERRAVEGIVSRSAGARSTKECAAKRHAPGGSNHCCIGVDGASTNRAAECCVTGVAERPCAGATTVDESDAGRHTQSSSDPHSVETEGGGADDEVERRAVDGIAYP